MSILITGPATALARAHSLRTAITASSATPEWSIINKYYTARVPVRVQDVDELEMGDARAVIYVFTSSEHSTPPPPLCAAITPAIELVYAARLPSEERFDPEADETAADGFGEYVNLSSLPFDASNAFREIKDALQTVPWPTMVRKPLENIRARRSEPAGVARLMDDQVDMAHEHAALDAWLDADDDPFPAPPRPMGKHSDAVETFADDFLPSTSAGQLSEEAFTPFQSAPASYDPDAVRKRSPIDTLDPSDPSDDDDETDDPAFLPSDPAPLLAHLTTIRSHLATIPDPDARRTIAARQVERLFAGLGIDLDSADFSP